MLLKLAFRNVRRQIGNYLIYFVTVSLTVALIFAVNNLIYSDLMEQITENMAKFIDALMVGVSCGLGLAAALVLGYVTSYLLRRRKKEFGLYLTMGMSRGNIITIFAGETAVNFLLSLGVGIAIGLGVFQLLMAVVYAFLGLPFAWTGYSLEGTLLTVAIVAGMFLLSSVVSVFDLGYAKISSLLQSEKKVERTGKYPFLWFILTVVSIVALVLAINRIFAVEDAYLEMTPLIVGILVAVLSIILLLFGLAKGLVPTLLQWKGFASRGANTFTLRQLSGRLNANAMMLSVLSLLLTIAVIATNSMVYTKTVNEAAVYQNFPCDVFGRVELRWLDTYLDGGRGAMIEDGIAFVEEYADVQRKVEYYVYSTTKDYSQEDLLYMRESDYIAVCEASGRTPTACEGGYLFLYPDDYWRLEEYEPITLNGVSYPFTGERKFILEPAHGLNTPRVCVVADEAVVGLTKAFHDVVIQLKNNRYDAAALFAKVTPEGMRYGTFALLEYEREDVLQEALIYLLIAIFVSIVFVLLAMAVIALKVLTMLSEDRERYRAIWRLGASAKTLKGSLFAQIFFFFFLPFGVPLALSVPLGFFFVKEATKSLLGVAEIFGMIAGVAGVLLLTYAVYFLITYFVACSDVKRNIQLGK